MRTFLDFKMGDSPFLIRLRLSPPETPRITPSVPFPKSSLKRFSWSVSDSFLQTFRVTPLSVLIRVRFLNVRAPSSCFLFAILALKANWKAFCVVVDRAGGPFLPSKGPPFARLVDPGRVIYCHNCRGPSPFARVFIVTRSFILVFPPPVGCWFLLAVSPPPSSLYRTLKDPGFKFSPSLTFLPGIIS